MKHISIINKGLAILVAITIVLLPAATSLASDAQPLQNILGSAYAARSVSVSGSAGANPVAGDSARLSAHINGYDGLHYSLTWQTSSGGGWSDIGGGSSLSVTLNAGNARNAYRMKITITGASGAATHGVVEDFSNSVTPAPNGLTVPATPVPPPPAATPAPVVEAPPAEQAPVEVKAPAEDKPADNPSKEQPQEEIKIPEPEIQQPEKDLAPPTQETKEPVIPDEPDAEKSNPSENQTIENPKVEELEESEPETEENSELELGEEIATEGNPDKPSETPNPEVLENSDETQDENPELPENTEPVLHDQDGLNQETPADEPSDEIVEPDAEIKEEQPQEEEAPSEEEIPGDNTPDQIEEPKEETGTEPVTEDAEESDLPDEPHPSIDGEAVMEGEPEALPIEEDLPTINDEEEIPHEEAALTVEENSEELALEVLPAEESAVAETAHVIPVGTLSVGANALYLYNAPSADADRITLLQPDSLVTVLSKDGTWAHISLDGVTGYLPLVNLVPAVQDSSVPPAVYAWLNQKEEAHYGDVISLGARIVGMEGMNYTTVWQHAAMSESGAVIGAWINQDGANALHYSYTLSESNASWAWRIAVYLNENP